MNKKIIALLAVGATLSGAFSASASTVFASHAKSVKVSKKHKRAKRRKKISKKKFKIPYKKLSNAIPVKVYVTKNVRMTEYNRRMKKTFKRTLGASQVVTVTQANKNAWIVTGLGQGMVNKGSICVVEGNGWFMNKEVRDQQIKNYRNRFNSSLRNQVGSQEYNAMRNQLNADGTNIRNWIEK